MDKHLSLLIENPIEYSKKLSINELESVIKYLDSKYYNSGDSGISDDLYDVLKNLLEERSPQSKVLKEVGAAPIDKNEKVKLPYYMGSCQKIKPDTKKIDNWMKKYGGPYVLSDKLDGISALLYHYKTTTGKWKNKLYTRGDGTFGRDITRMLKYLYTKKFLQEIPEKKLAIRGEIIISKKEFKKYSKDFTNSRSFASGIVNSSKPTPSNAKTLELVTFELLYPLKKSKSEQLEILRSMNFETVDYEVVKTINNKMLSEKLLDRRENSIYEVDGIIVNNDKPYPVNQEKNPKHAFAFKMILLDQVAESIVLDVEWNVSRHGKLKPVVISESVKIGGTILHRVTGIHGQYIKENMIGIGARIKIVRSGDVIPKITEVISPASKPKFPDVPYYWDGLEIMLKETGDKPSNEIIVKKFVHFIKTLKIKEVGAKSLETIVGSGINTLKKLINAKEEDYLKLERFGKKSSKNTYDNIQNAIKDVSLEQIMVASHIFPTGFGLRKIKMILAVYPNILNEENIEEKVLGIKGFAKGATLFSTNLPEFKKFLNEHPEITLKATKKIESKNNTKYSNKNFVFTGVRDKQLIETIEESGGKIVNTVTKKVNVVITKDVESTSSKIKKAMALNITIMTLEEFKNNY